METLRDTWLQGKKDRIGATGATGSGEGCRCCYLLAYLYRGGAFGRLQAKGRGAVSRQRSCYPREELLSGKHPTRGAEGTESRAPGSKQQEEQVGHLFWASEVGVGQGWGWTQTTTKLNRAGRTTRGPGIALPSIQLFAAVYLICSCHSPRVEAS